MSSFREIIAKQIVVDGSVSSSFGKGILAAADAAGARFVIDAAASSHASEHATGGGDALAPSDIGAATSAQGSLADSAVQPGDLAAVATTGNLGDLSDVSTSDPTADKSFLIYSSGAGEWIASTGIGTVGVGPQPLGGWPSGSVGESLAGKASASHASTHATGGSDAIAPSDIGAAPAASPEISGVITVAPAGAFSVGYLTATGDGLKISNANTVDGNGNYGAGISWTRNATANNRNAGIASVQTSNDPDQTGLAFFTHSSTTASADMAEQMRLTHAGRLGVNTADPASALDVSGVITVAAGSAAAPAIVASGDSNTGIAFPAADTFSVSTAGTERLRVDSSGNVGIGIDPNVPLQLKNFVAPDNETPANRASHIRLYESGTSVIYGFGISSSRLNISGGTGQVAVFSGGSETARFTATNQIEVQGGLDNGAKYPGYSFDGDPDSGFGQFAGANTISAITGGVERVRVGSDGLMTASVESTASLPVNISEMLSGPKLLIHATSDSATHSAIALRTRTTASTVANIGLGYGSGTGDGFLFFTIRTGGGTLREAMRIKSTGAVRFVPLAADPSTGNEAGDVYYNSTTNKLRVYNGTSWIDLH